MYSWKRCLPDAATSTDHSLAHVHMLRLYAGIAMHDKEHTAVGIRGQKLLTEYGIL